MPWGRPHALCPEVGPTLCASMPPVLYMLGLTPMPYATGSPVYSMPLALPTMLYALRLAPTLYALRLAPYSMPWD
jgi:hypothetical protein